MEHGRNPSAELSQEQRDHILHKRILPIFRGEETAPLPDQKEVAIVGGQPGCGKTGLLAAITQELKSRGATWQINGDDFYAFHPSYGELQRKFGAQAAEMVKADASYWTQQTLRAATERGVNIALETTLRQPPLVASTLESLRHSGYRTHLLVMAVKGEVSWQGNHIRRESLSLAGSATRLADRKTHDDALKGVVATVSAIQQEKLADRVTVHLRPTAARPGVPAPIVYDSASRRFGGLTAAEVVEHVRAHPMSAELIDQHSRVWDKLLKMAEARHVRERAPAEVASHELKAMKNDRERDISALNQELRSDRQERGRAQALRELPRDQALKVFPELRDAYALIDTALGAVPKANDTTRQRVELAMREQLAKQMEQGRAQPAASSRQVGQVESPSKPAAGTDRER